MSNPGKALGAVIVAASLAGCISHGPEGVSYSRGDTPATGATSGAGGGSLSGAPASGEPVEKEKRGTTPVGVDRDGHGPAAGAIVDPTGAATRGKPY
ncbi:MAG TPA: hypothetical protein VD867_11580 [Burkholderiales bacterium]|nr:hypothetical protein [Burkholderiales bacterium]